MPRPPISTTCRVQANSPTAVPRRKVGVTITMSLRWPVPCHGSLTMIGVAVAHLLERHLVEHVADAHRHRVDVARRAGDGLGQHAALRCRRRRPRGRPPRASPCRRRCAPGSAPAPRRRRSGGSTSPGIRCGSADGWRLCSLCGLLQHGCLAVRRMAPDGSSAAVKPEVTMVVVSSSAMTAGPCDRLPGFSALRSIDGHVA